VNAVESFDKWCAQQLERLRGHPVADPVFKAASELGDFSGIWHLISVGRALTHRSVARESVALSALIGVESLVVNQGVKRLFGRIRPTESGDPRYPVRRPSTSSFPSVHASSAFFAAAILTTASGKRMAPVWYTTATIVALSRAYVRIHHPSDVVAGAAVGVALGKIGSKVFKAVT